MGAMQAPAVEASGLTRVFDARMAVQDLSLTVGAGEVVALLGPNGAGKTTTLRMLAGLLAPTGGRIALGGEPLTPATADALRSRVGLLTEAPGLWERLTVRANLQTYARLHGVTNPGARVTQLLEAVGLGPRADDRAGSLSKGLKQRAAMARALIHNPPVVLLDEPTSGLDPASAHEMRALVRGLRGEGRAVLVSTHNLLEAEDLADRIAIVNTRLVACDTPRALRARQGGGSVLIEVDGALSHWVAVLQGLSGEVTVDGTGLIAATGPGADVPDLVAALAAAGARVRRVEPRERSLEQAYLDLVGRDG
jgi:ABC-2 type transport system ATP-binding protein